MVFLADMGEIEVADLVVDVEVDEQASISNRDVAGHLKSFCKLYRRAEQSELRRHPAMEDAATSFLGHSGRLLDRPRNFTQTHTFADDDKIVDTGKSGSWQNNLRLNIDHIEG